MDTIYSYTRRQALDDGVLVDVTELAQEAGFVFPMAVTRTLWNDYIEPTESQQAAGQSADGRLWDILFMLRWELRTKETCTHETIFRVIVDGKIVPLKALCHPGDHMEAVLTIMLPDED